MHKSNPSIPFIDNRKLVIGLAATHSLELTPSNITKINNSSTELALFKKQFSNLPTSYARHSQSIWRYRCIFFGLSLLFAGLAAITFAHNLAFSQVLLDSLRNVVKNSLGIIEISLAIGSLLIGWSLCAMREATSSIVFKNKRRAAHLYARKRLACGFDGLWPTQQSNSESSRLKRRYKELLIHIEEQRVETLGTLRSIQQATQLDAAKRERLYSQALLELDRNLQQLTFTFRHQ